MKRLSLSARKCGLSYNMYPSETRGVSRVFKVGLLTAIQCALKALIIVSVLSMASAAQDQVLSLTSGPCVDDGVQVGLFCHWGGTGSCTFDYNRDQLDESPNVACGPNTLRIFYPDGSISDDRCAPTLTVDCFQGEALTSVIVTTVEDTEPSPDPEETLPSPIIVDLSGNGFFLTDAAHGVLFDIEGTGIPMHIAWIATGADNGLLALPGSDGLVHNGKELFGNFTPQPPTVHPNGFLALSVYDQSANGGNGDGIIDSRDSVYSRLRIWVDSNHDGICQPGELHTLPEMGVLSISLDYSLSRRTDEFGNVFRYRAKVNPGQNGQSDVGRKAYDVFFVSK